MVDMDRIRNAFADKQSPLRVHRMWQSIEAACIDTSPAPSRWCVTVLATGAVVAAALMLALIWPKADVGPLMLQAGAPIKNTIVTAQPMRTRFSDGSFLDTAKGTSLKLVENTSHSVAFSMLQGEAYFNIQPGGPRVWRVNCMGIFVTVVGTAFVCRGQSEQVTLEVKRGAVLVDGKGVEKGPRKLVAGNAITVGPKHVFTKKDKDNNNDNDVNNVDNMNNANENGDNAGRSNLTASRAPHASAAQPVWKIQAEAGNYIEAFDRLGADKVASLTAQSNDVDELFQLSDVARRNGHPRDAIGPLETIIRRFPQNARAALASYTLGRLYLEHLKAPVKATEAFKKALSLGLPAALTETAEAKQIRAMLQYNTTEGKKLASEYLMRYPDGRYRQKVEAWLQATVSQ
ncbi:MAG: FecR domain-containing protein [Deltaproteobacteria bacterium]|nr:FecR domain-containing protein [Deltaproteobacteria bacterium]